MILGKDIVLPPETKPDDVSDGFHTIGELYRFRAIFNAVLFNEWASQAKYFVHKSRRHYNGELCFGGGWFIVAAKLPAGLISNHYPMEVWDLFHIPETEKSIFEYDGHTSSDTLQRLISLIAHHESGSQSDC